MEEWRSFSFVRECQLFACQCGLWYERTPLLETLQALLELVPQETTYADHLYITQMLERLRAGLARHVHASLHREYGGDVDACLFNALKIARDEALGANGVPLTEAFLDMFKKYLDQLEAAHPIPAAARAATLISHHLGEQMSLLDLARAVGCHPVPLRAQFKQLYGITIREYKTRCRVHRAAVLLRETDRPITEIAEESGFRCLGHFYRAFMRLIHSTPSQYRHNDPELGP